jgi:hypothetical protein
MLVSAERVLVDRRFGKPLSYWEKQKDAASPRTHKLGVVELIGSADDYSLAELPGKWGGRPRPRPAPWPASRASLGRSFLIAGFAAECSRLAQKCRGARFEPARRAPTRPPPPPSRGRRLALELVRQFQITKLAVFPRRVNRLHRRQTLRVPEVPAQRQPPIHAVVDPRIVQIA